MFKLSDQDSDRLISRIKDISGIIIKPPLQVVTDTTDFMRIGRGHIIWLDGRKLFVSGDVYEPRFGLEDQPKFWVKRGYELDSGQKVIIKLEFHEEFVKEIGPMRILCFRSPEKESAVLRLVAGDSRFIQGETLIDDSGNNVRVIKFIEGETLFNKIMEMEMDHEQYYHTCLVPILQKLIGCFEAIQMLHDHGLCHGDIRNDHILIEKESGEFRWFDFDLHQNFASFDVLSLGKVLQFVVGMGLTTFHEIRTGDRFPADVISSLQLSDAGAFYTYRLMNLKKIYPYISERLNTILMRFSIGTENYYKTVIELKEDLCEAINEVSASCSNQA